MLRRISEKPDCLNRLADNGFFFEVTRNGTVVASVGVEIINDTGHMHMIVHKTTHNILKTIIGIWDQLVSFCKDNGCSRLVASSSTKEPEKFRKFINCFGFTDMQEIYVATQEI